MWYKVLVISHSPKTAGPSSHSMHLCWVLPVYCEKSTWLEAKLQTSETCCVTKTGSTWANGAFVCCDELGIRSLTQLCCVLLHDLTEIKAVELNRCSVTSPQMQLLSVAFASSSEVTKSGLSSGLLVDWLEHLDPEVTSVCPDLQQKLLFALNKVR